MRYMKKIAAPKSWPVERKEGGKYIVKPLANPKKGIALLVILRDILKLAGLRNEIRKILKNSDILVNNRVVKDDRFAVLLQDTIAIPRINKYFRLKKEKDKIALEEINKDEAARKICKVTGKKILKKGKTQINLEDGRNFLSQEKLAVGDSILWDFEKNRMIKHLPLKKGCLVRIFSGKNAGEEGKVLDITQEGDKKTILIETERGKIKSDNENIRVVG